MQEEFFNVWNDCDKIDKDHELLHLTNNGLEIYNKHFNTICSNSHPNFVAFVHALCKQADRDVQRMDNVSKGREIPPQYNEPVFPKFLQISILMTKSQKQRTMLQERAGEQRRVLSECVVMGLLVWVGSLSLCSSVSDLF